MRVRVRKTMDWCSRTRLSKPSVDVHRSFTVPGRMTAARKKSFTSRQEFSTPFSRRVGWRLLAPEQGSRVYDFASSSRGGALMRGLFLYSFVLVGSLASLPAAKADTFTTYVFSSVNPWFPYGMDAPGDVVLDNTPSNPVTYEIWNAGVLLSTTSTLPAGFVADDGAACALPSVPDAFGPAVCNGSREVYAINNGTPDNLVYEIYP